MKKIGTLSIAILFMAGVAVAGENVTQSEENVKEKTIHSTTVQEDADQTGEMKHKSTTVEKKRQTTTSSDDIDGDTTTRQKVEVEKKRSKTTTSEDADSPSLGATQEYHHQSETHQHTTTEVEKK